MLRISDVGSWSFALRMWEPVNYGFTKCSLLRDYEQKTARIFEFTITKNERAGVRATKINVNDNVNSSMDIRPRLFIRTLNVK